MRMESMGASQEFLKSPMLQPQIVRIREHSFILPNFQMSRNSSSALLYLNEHSVNYPLLIPRCHIPKARDY